MKSSSYPNNSNMLSSPEYEVLSRQNQRENNEDSFQVFTLTPRSDRPPIYILAVADGMGGHAYGEQASEQTLRKLSLSLFESLTVESSINSLPQQLSDLSPDRLSKSLQDALKAANEHIRRIVKQNNWGVSGSTVVVAAILENTAVVINLGDSPLFHYQARARKTTQITEDHTVAGVLQRSGMITAEMARHHEGRSRLQFFVGCSHLPPELQTYTIELEPNDILLLCSDGVSGSLLPEDINKILTSQQNLKEKAKSLVDKALANQETDNQTLILWSQPASLESSPQVIQSANNKSNSTFIEPGIDEDEKGNSFLKLLVLPLILIGALAFGAYAFTWLLSNNAEKQNPKTTVTKENKEDIESKDSATNNESSKEPKKPKQEQTGNQERDQENIESSNRNTQKPEPAKKDFNKQKQSETETKVDRDGSRPNYHSCDRDPKPPSSAPRRIYKVYIKYQNTAPEEFNEIEGILTDVCRNENNKNGQLAPHFKKLEKEPKFEVWFTDETERRKFITKIKRERNKRSKFIEILCLDPESSEKLCEQTESITEEK